MQVWLKFFLSQKIQKLIKNVWIVLQSAEGYGTIRVNATLVNNTICRRVWNCLGECNLSQQYNLQKGMELLGWMQPQSTIKNDLLTSFPFPFHLIHYLDLHQTNLGLHLQQNNWCMVPIFEIYIFKSPFILSCIRNFCLTSL